MPGSSSVVPNPLSVVDEEADRIPLPNLPPPFFLSALKFGFLKSKFALAIGSGLVTSDGLYIWNGEGVGRLGAVLALEFFRKDEFGEDLGDTDEKESYLFFLWET